MSRKHWLFMVGFILIVSLMTAFGTSAFAGATSSAVFQPNADVRAHAPVSDYVVNSLDDATDESCDLTHCSLRDAITLANSNAGPHFITFSVSGIITLTSSLPLITGTLTIDGSGQNITVSGANAYQVMHLNRGAPLTLTALTIMNGSSDFYGDGPDNWGALTVKNSTFSSNSAVYGGGAGAGVYNADTLTVTTSTFHGNASSSGGGIYSVGTTTAQNTIIARSIGGGNCAGSVINGGNNLDSDGSCGWGSGNGSLSRIDPRLGPLADNGGSTLTMALLPDTPRLTASRSMRPTVALPRISAAWRVPLVRAATSVRLNPISSRTSSCRWMPKALLPSRARFSTCQPRIGLQVVRRKS